MCQFYIDRIQWQVPERNSYEAEWTKSNSKGSNFITEWKSKSCFQGSKNSGNKEKGRNEVRTRNGSYNWKEWENNYSKLTLT